MASTSILPPDILPSYSVSQPPPCYSCSLACGEQLIQRTPRVGSRPSGTFKKRSGGTTVLLTEQNDDATVPSYGRHGSVNGLVAFENREHVTEVKAKLVGQMRLIIPGASSRQLTLVNEHQTLWSSNSTAASSSTCPGTIPFSFTFPTTFKDKSDSYPLPPSFDLSCLGPSGLTASVKYTIEVKVVKGHTRGLGLWPKDKKITIPIKYMPRSRPPHPILSESDLFPDIKVSPEEWHQTLTTINSRSPETIPPLNAHIFIPSTKVFAYGETIPLHVQVNGPLVSLGDISGQSPDSKGRPPAIQVHLLRQVSIDVNGSKAWRNSILAHGQLRAIPPPMSSITNSACSREDSLDWEGELQVPKNVNCPSFNVGGLIVKDFVVLTVIPAEPRKSSLQYHQSSVSIRLVTDTWSEIPTAP
ncbi:hypothetical protein V5O48_010733 [Marasmius crinis-equi]|uniref:Arrestin-like N-terminal domain-containing protein n=1 Tax=Marasmius crinis-equi TaxID=585013 RepID=A0ABR3F7K7_9AGAR